MQNSISSPRDEPVPGESAPRAIASDSTLIAQTGFAYFPLAFIARFPFAMMVVGVLTLVVSARGSVELGGMNSAVVGIGSAVVGPLIGAAADRYGQRPTLLITAAVNSVTLGVLAWVAYSTLPVWVMFVSAFLVGASSPQIAPMSRSRLVTLIASALPPRRRARAMSTTLAYESAADETVFVFGPVIVGLLATAFGAWAPILGAIALTLVFVTAFAMHHTSAPAKTAAERAATLAPSSELWRPSLLIVVFGTFSVGCIFGTTLTALTAFMQDQGRAESAGLIYGIMGIGSAFLAISVALFSPRFTLRYRWVVFTGFIIGGGFILPSATGVGTVSLALGLMGVGIGPLLVTLFSFGAGRSPEGRSATVMTMLGSALILGQSSASALTGFVAEGFSTPAALTLPLGAAGLALLGGVVNWFLTPAGRGPAIRTGSIPVAGTDADAVVGTDAQ